MKLLVHGAVSLYEVSVERGTYSVFNRTTERPWDTRGVADLADDQLAAAVAVTAIDAVDGPVRVERLTPA